MNMKKLSLCNGCMIYKRVKCCVNSFFIMLVDVIKKKKKKSLDIYFLYIIHNSIGCIHMYINVCVCVDESTLYAVGARLD